MIAMAAHLAEADRAAPPAPVAVAVAAAREAQRAWAARPVRERLLILRRLRHAIGRDPVLLASAIGSPARSTADKLASEVLPLADAIRFLEREAPRLLKPARYGRRGRPLWLGRVHLEVRRGALGVVLVVGPSNYPLLLAGVQAVQALGAGNGVLVKPAPGHSEPVRRLAALAADAGVDPRLLVVLREDTAVVAEAAAAGVDKVVLTGSAETGQAVLATLAPHVIPSVMELSGHDAVFVCDGADVDVVARCVAYGLTFNGGATCIAPRRVFVPKERATEFEAKLMEALSAREPDGEQERERRYPLSPVPRGEGGGEGLERVRIHVARAGDGAGPCRPESGRSPESCLSFEQAARTSGPIGSTRPGSVPCANDVESQEGPSPQPSPLSTGERGKEATPAVSVILVRDMDHALVLNNECPYRLGAAVFGSAGVASDVATKIDAGCVVINDVIVPIADPRLPFGGRGRSGFGVTRGAEGLLEMTVVKAVAARKGSFRPHLERPHRLDEQLFRHYAAAAHGATLSQRVRGAIDLVSTLLRRSKS